MALGQTAAGKGERANIFTDGVLYMVATFLWVKKLRYIVSGLWLRIGLTAGSSLELAAC